MNTPVGPEFSDALAVEAGFSGSFTIGGVDFHFRESCVGVFYDWTSSCFALRSCYLHLANGFTLNTDASPNVDNLTERNSFSWSIGLNLRNLSRILCI